MRTKRRLKAAALTAFAVVLGLFTVQGSYALWSAAASASPGTITSASFDVALKAVNTGLLTNMTLTKGTAATLTLSPVGTLGPGTSVNGGVVVTNNTNAGGQFNTAITAAQPIIANVNGGTLASYVGVNAKTAASSSECNTPSSFAPISSAGLVSPTVALVAGPLSTAGSAEEGAAATPPSSGTACRRAGFFGRAMRATGMFTSDAHLQMRTRY
ncbi:hypothetical protein QF031_000843 [Pseudarthrobacter defluvii]|uniref:hypothetical protein n=1 Tax=Pseudarthrobacter defluvii TaxID=410837 RepID=UPI0027859E1F|nr:hypothetical protein [Pseudarthrobacter defluvii]MDQ0768094.1 hypothetical protein [Pseudarthrobacter defluvii]